MLADLAGLLQNVDVFFAELRVWMFRIVRVDQLREAQSTGHAGGPTADNDHIRGHLRTLNAGEGFAERSAFIQI